VLHTLRADFRNRRAEREPQQAEIGGKHHLGHTAGQIASSRPPHSRERGVIGAAHIAAESCRGGSAFRICSIVASSSETSEVVPAGI